MITQELIEQRKAALEAERERVLGYLNTLSGRIAELEHWLAEIDKPVAPEPDGRVSAQEG